MQSGLLLSQDVLITAGDVLSDQVMHDRKSGENAYRSRARVVYVRNRPHTATLVSLIDGRVRQHFGINARRARGFAECLRQGFM